MLMVDFVLFDNIRGALQVFDIPFVVTAGGPGYASSTFTLYTIKTAFTYSNVGMAATMAIAIMVMILVIYVVQNKIITWIDSERREEIKMAKRVLSQTVKQIICLCMVVTVLAPILLTLFASLKTKADMAVTSPLQLPSLSNITFENFKKVLSNKYLLLGFKNTAIIMVVSLIFNVMFGTIPAFIIERFQTGRPEGV